MYNHVLAAAASTGGLDAAKIGTSLLSVVIAGIIFGAGIPALFAVGVRASASEATAVKGVGYAIYAFCALLAVAAILVIFFGNSWFGK